jgi:hypothetical protein
VQRAQTSRAEWQRGAQRVVVIKEHLIIDDTALIARKMTFPLDIASIVVADPVSVIGGYVGKMILRW